MVNSLSYIAYAEAMNCLFEPMVHVVTGTFLFPNDIGQVVESGLVNQQAE